MSAPRPGELHASTRRLQLLQAHGTEVVHARDGAQALRFLDTRGPIDLVLSHVVMPGPLDGLALARQLRREQPALPIVLISGFAPTGDAARDFRLLRKPVAQSDLLGALNGVLAAARSKN